MSRRLTVLCACWVVATAVPAKSDDNQFFRDQIEPVLKQECYRCHSDQADKLEGASDWTPRQNFAAAEIRGRC